MSPIIPQPPTSDRKLELYRPTVVSHYRPEMAPPEVACFSKSPTKPRRFMEFIARSPLNPYLVPSLPFPPVSTAQLATAHTDAYIQSFLTGLSAELGATRPDGSGIPWTETFARSVMFTNGSLISATRAALREPQFIHLSPTSGFHHATPGEGQGFCTFSGQVIAAIDAWRTYRARTVWIDLDGHYGNSIEDTRSFAPELEEAIPRDCNINPAGARGQYIRDLGRSLLAIHRRVIAGELNCICVALGADSHEWDSLGGNQLDTESWLAAVDLVFSFIRDWSEQRGKPVPVVLSLFGGYRDDHPESVLGLHAMGVARSLVWLANATELGAYSAEVRDPSR